MGRYKSKVQLSLIKDQNQRKITCQKRKAGLKKKAYELSTLCDIPVLALFFDPSTGEVDSWPENAQEAREIMERYMSSSKKSREESTFSPPSFNKAQTCELQSDLKNARLAKLQRLEAKIKSVDERIQLLEKGHIMAEGSSELGNSTYRQDSMQESVRCDSPCEVMMLGQSDVDKGTGIPNIDLVNNRIEFVENGSNNYVVSNESLEKERTAFWQDLLMEDSMPEYSFGAFLDFELDSFTVNLQVGNCDGGAHYINFAKFDHLGVELMQDYPLSSDFYAPEELPLFY
ncbi:MADS-box transcription factor 14-like [Asparagus officinalis]|uniref:MADS-box transcription factor 14-like n=1 Tax=Asparagus officinalis TaxID=4686 RepID=UPI00098E63F3|nr:MADS-box transcription factor 14-like [Asparagus officinalis]